MNGSGRSTATHACSVMARSTRSPSPSRISATQPRGTPPQRTTRPPASVAPASGSTSTGGRQRLGITGRCLAPHASLGTAEQRESRLSSTRQQCSTCSRRVSAGARSHLAVSLLRQRSGAYEGLDRRAEVEDALDYALAVDELRSAYLGADPPHRARAAEVIRADLDGYIAWLEHDRLGPRGITRARMMEQLRDSTPAGQFDWGRGAAAADRVAFADYVALLSLKDQRRRWVLPPATRSHASAEARARRPTLLRPMARRRGAGRPASRRVHAPSRGDPDGGESEPPAGANRAGEPQQSPCPAGPSAAIRADRLAAAAHISAIVSALLGALLLGLTIVSVLNPPALNQVDCARSVRICANTVIVEPWTSSVTGRDSLRRRTRGRRGLLRLPAERRPTMTRRP
jgi:hypothetical protein